MAAPGVCITSYLLTVTLVVNVLLRSPPCCDRAGIPTQVAQLGSLLSCHSSLQFRGTWEDTGRPQVSLRRKQSSGNKTRLRPRRPCSAAVLGSRPAQGGDDWLPTWARIKVRWSLFPQIQGSRDRSEKKRKETKGQEKVNPQRFLVHRGGLRKCAWRRGGRLIS